MRRPLVLVIVLLAVVYVVVQLLRPVPGVRVSAITVAARMPGVPATPTWPVEGESAIGVEGSGVLETHGAQSETPIASLTKIMMAYVVLQDHPLAISASGPEIVVSPQDVAVYQKDLANGDSVVEVQVGEQMSELQALEALLVPSGDNVATLLADWDAGSVPAFVARMNAEAQRLGLDHTHYADVSGVSPETVSTARDQLRLTMTALQNPVFAGIVAMTQVTLPVAGVAFNVDSQLGTDGIVGVKTGFTPAAGACFAFAATASLRGGTETIVGVDLGQFATPGHPSALTNVFTASETLLTSTGHLLERATVLNTGALLGHIDAPWSPPVALETSHAMALTGLPGQHVLTKIFVPTRIGYPIPKGHPIGTASVGLRDHRTIQDNRARLVTSRSLGSASLVWRLTRL